MIVASGNCFVYRALSLSPPAFSPDGFFLVICGGKKSGNGCEFPTGG